MELNWLNVFYAVEWVVFAGFAVFLWYRLVRDAVERERDEAEAGRAQAAPGHPAAAPTDVGAAGRLTVPPAANAGCGSQGGAMILGVTSGRPARRLLGAS